MSKAWAGGSTRAWRKLRRAILNRDQWRCQLRLPGCTHRATHVHHVLGKGVSERPADLVAACRSCNLKVGDPRRSNPDPRPRRQTRW